MFDKPTQFIRNFLKPQHSVERSGFDRDRDEQESYLKIRLGVLDEKLMRHEQKDLANFNLWLAALEWKLLEVSHNSIHFSSLQYQAPVTEEVPEFMSLICYNENSITG